MSLDSSSSGNTSFQPDSVLHQQVQCMNLIKGSLTGIFVMVTQLLLLLPLNALVLYLSHQRWRRRRPSAAAAALTHSDVFAVHVSVLQLISNSAAVLTCSGVYTDNAVLAMVGILLGTVNLTGVMLFHTLTCVERHLAVVHPVTYLGLKNAKGIRIRNITIGVVWLMSFGGSSAMFLSDRDFAPFTIMILSLVLIMVCFCSLSVLRVLVRPGPADRSGRRQQVDQSKLRAFHTITAILCVLLLKFGGTIFSFGMFMTQMFDKTGVCFLWASMFWFCLPSDLVSPLLFLLRAGKLRCCQTLD